MCCISFLKLTLKTISLCFIIKQRPTCPLLTKAALSKLAAYALPLFLPYKGIFKRGSVCALPLITNSGFITVVCLVFFSISSQITMDKAALRLTLFGLLFTCVNLAANKVNQRVTNKKCIWGKCLISQYSWLTSCYSPLVYIKLQRI